METHTEDQGGFNPEKMAVWDKVREDIESFADKLGRGVDEGIKEALAGLIVSGFHSTGSCEGHLDHGTRAPWVDIETRDAPALYRKAKDATSDEEKEAILEEIMRKNLEERRRLIAILDDFYGERKVPIHQMLSTSGYGHKLSRLESIGSDIQAIEDEETRQTRLEEYQEEMRAFSEYLKKLFFECGVQE